MQSVITQVRLGEKKAPDKEENNQEKVICNSFTSYIENLEDYIFNALLPFYQFSFGCCMWVMIWHLLKVFRKSLKHHQTIKGQLHFNSESYSDNTIKKQI